MKKMILVFSLSLVLGIVSTADAQSCYSAREFEAEQGLRIHSELMVIGLTCAKAPGGRGLYADYQMFTRKNQTLITQYESDMINYYRAQGVVNPEKELHTLRTSLANQISKRAIHMHTVSFCKNFSPRIQQALSMDQGKLRRWAQQVWAESPTTRPVCKGN